MKKISYKKKVCMGISIYFLPFPDKYGKAFVLRKEMRQIFQETCIIILKARAFGPDQFFKIYEMLQRGSFWPPSLSWVNLIINSYHDIRIYEFPNKNFDFHECTNDLLFTNHERYPYHELIIQSWRIIWIENFKPQERVNFVPFLLQRES